MRDDFKCSIAHRNGNFYCIYTSRYTFYNKIHRHIIYYIGKASYRNDDEIEDKNK